MRLKAKIEISGAHADLIATPLMYDNMGSIKTVIEGESVVIHFDASKLSTLIASVDDYLMNATVAWEIVELVEKEETEGKGERQ
jgi:tRNA threonylcarbamoyladenosine modification (KEOPS) complex  Pcc1 subunit